jgi:predicted amidohydrolase YtcJ
MSADTVLIEGNLITMDPSQPNADAIAIKNDKIVKIGTNEEIKSLIGENTKVIKLQGRTVIPGLIDSHIHVADFGKVLTWLNLHDVNSIEEMKKRIKKRANRIPKGRWIIGNGWNQTSFIEKRYPNIQDMNEAAPENPIIMYHQYGRVCIVNSKALEAAKITKETLNPPGGIIETDPKTGKLTGILRETATDLVWKKVPEPNEEQIIKSAILAFKKIVEVGVTSIHWIVKSVNEILIIQKLRSENKLPIRIRIIAPMNILNHLYNLSSFKNIEDNWGVKIFVDGSLAARTAALHEPYSDNPKTTGNLSYSQKELNILVAKAHKANLSLVMHAMGDKAIDMSLTAIEKALINTPKENHRHRIEHASVLNKDLIQRIKSLKIVVSIQPKCVISEFLVWSAIERLGPKRARWLYPVKTLINEGIRVIGGSDCPMEPLSPLLAIQEAVTRKYFTEEQIEINDALQMYTINAAYASFEENIKGSLDKGKLADLTILSGDPRNIPSNKIGDIKVHMTIVGGKIVYQKLNEQI